MKKILLFVFLSIIPVFLFSQNRYLSFFNGEENFKSQKTLPERLVHYQKDKSIKIQFKFSGAQISETTAKDTLYNYLHISGIHKMGQIGAPALPAKNEIIAMPKGSNGKIVIIDAEYYEYKGYNIHPALKPATDREGDPEPEFEKDYSIYNSNEFFPKNVVEIVDVGKSRGTPLAKTQIRPVQFNPVTNTIRVYTNITFRIDFEGGENNFDYIAQNNSIHYTNLLKLNVINSDVIPNGITKEQRDPKAGAKEYIIITHSQYLTQANELANWKRQMGYSVEVVSQSSWTYTQVETEVHDRYNSWTPKPDYFVIIGDHTGSYAVPGKEITDPYYGDTFATDLYVACMDGASDWHPDMAHGRISVSSAAEAQILIDKIINYELNPTTTSSFYSNALNCAQYQDEDNNGYADRRFCHTSEDIRDYLQDDQGYTSERVYYTSSTYDVTQLRYNNADYSNGQLLPADLRTTTFNWSGDENDITPSIDAGKFLVFHRDHGYTGGSGWAHPYYTTTTMTSLSNGDLLPVVFSMNCHTGEFQLSNCFAEKFLRMDNKGAVGVIGAAYYSLSGYNDALSIGMIDAIWADPGIYPVFGSGGTGNNYTIGAGNEIYTLGDVVNQGLYAMEQNWNGNPTYNQYEYELFHYFGDPAMKIWTEDPNPNAITATHSSTIDCAQNLFSITGSTPGATATLVFNNELIGEVVLDASGNGDIPYTLSSPGSVTLTISKTNCKPYVYTLSQTCPGYPPELITNAATGVTGTDATLNGEITNDQGETITESGFVYSTSPNPIIGGAGVTKVQTSPTVTMGTYSEPITGLTSSTTYYYKAYAINANGTGYGDEEAFTTDCGTYTLPFTEDFSDGALPLCWENIDNQGNGQIWEFNNPGGRSINTTSNANGFAILDSDNYGNGNSQNADLVTPTLDLSAYSNVNLYFEHYFREYSGESATLSYSIDGGSTWNVIQTWLTTTTNAATFDQAIPAVDGESNVKFKWNYTGSWGYYWAVDDINITGDAACTYPTTQANNFSSTPAETSINVSWDRGDGDAVIVVAREGSAVNQDPSDGVSYTANAAFSSGDEIGTGNYVVYNGTGTSVNVTGLTANTTYYFAIYEYTSSGNCYLIPALTGNDLTLPTAPTSVTASSTDICEGDNVTLSYSGGTGATFAWYSGSCGGTSVGTGQNLVIAPTTTTTYYGRWENASGNTTCQSVTVNVTALPIAPTSVTATPNPITIGNSTTLTYTGGSGTTFTWFTGSCGGTSVGTGQDLVVSPTVTTTYYGAWSNSCGQSTCQSVTVTVNPDYISWNGSVDSDWQTTGNWDGGNIPTSSDDITIPNGMPNYPVIDDGTTTAECNNITIESGASVTIAPNGQMTVAGEITNNAGNTGLVINSDATGTGSLIHNSTSGVDASVDLFFESPGRSWHMVSSPMTSATLSVFPSSANLYIYDESTNDFWTGTSYDAGSVMGWTNPSGNMTVAKGYVFNYYQTTLNFTGQLNTNNATNSITINYTNHGNTAPNGASYDDFDGWNFIGNPYTAAIDWDDPNIDHSAANILDAIYYYDDLNAHTYASYVGGVGTNGGTQYIPAMQGFFIKGDASETGGTLNIPASAIVHNSQDFWKNNNSNQINNILRLSVNDNNFSDETVVRFHKNATFNMDKGLDAFKFFTWDDNAPQIYTRIENVSSDYSINSIPELFNGQTYSVPLKVLTNSDEFDIRVDKLNLANTIVYLKDNLNSDNPVTYLLKETKVYSFNSTSFDAKNRFELIFQKQATFTNEITDKSILLYPNPTKGEIFIDIINYSDDYNVKITNVAGKLIYDNNFSGKGIKTIKLNIAKGVYFMSFKLQNQKIYTKKLIIK